MQLVSSRWVSISFVEAVVLCLLASFRLINLESTVTLLIFNLLFTSLIFQLKGAVNKKLFLLALGNVIGLFWSYVFCSVSAVGTLVFGEGFNVVYAIFFPFLNFTWVVSFWSLSLTVLTPQANTGTEVKA
ncbi:hypothetical protein G4O51_08690 [Candidatus Bathyarchaeota archaeon A05DMB-2]|jgi:hypothetical protein|nr:hypothetical protein [Candidatus Bathyarchaeota archaeon A05DMB-2]